MEHQDTKEEKLVQTSKTDETQEMSDSELIKSLPTEGIITFDPTTLYWYIKLPEKWQNERQNIATLAFNYFKDNDKHLKSVELCKTWSLMINDSDPKIECVSPPSISGLHISLDHIANDDNKPKQLIEGETVSFIINDIKLYPTTRQFPQNIDGQFTSNDGLRYYPTLWVLAEIEFKHFTYNTKYSPHISLACMAVELSVDAVDKLIIKKKNENTSIDENKVQKHIQQNEPQNCIKSSKSDFDQIYPQKKKDTILKTRKIQETESKKRVCQIDQEDQIKPHLKKQRTSEIQLIFN
eukprot:146549_1